VERLERRRKEGHLAREVKVVLTHKLVREPPAADFPWLPFAAKVAGAFWRLPLINGWIKSTLGGRMGQVGRLREAGKKTEAFELAVRLIPEGLAKGLDRTESVDSPNILDAIRAPAEWAFWRMLLNAVQLAGTDEQRRQLFPFIDGLPVSVGLQPAQVYEAYSRWYWQTDPAEAIRVAETAIDADPTWPESYLTMAFYLLHSKLGDPLPVLADAVRADPTIWPEVEKRFGAEMASAVRKAVES
jgi:hypothetical protein